VPVTLHGVEGKSNFEEEAKKDPNAIGKTKFVMTQSI